MLGGGWGGDLKEWGAVRKFAQDRKRFDIGILLGRNWFSIIHMMCRFVSEIVKERGKERGWKMFRNSQDEYIGRKRKHIPAHT